MTLSRFALIILSCSAACGLSCAQALGQAKAVTLSAPKLRRSRFGLSYRAGFNMSVRFENVGTGAGANPGSVAGDIPHNYDDGYVRVDVSGNAGGQTWYWGYQNANQIQGDQLVFSASNPGSISGDTKDSPQHGVELTYAYQVSKRTQIRWGLESALGYTDLSFRDQSVPSSSALVVDSYSLGGITPPLAPYAGTFNGPGPLISDIPTRLPVSVASHIDASLYDLRLGPYLELPLGRHASVDLSCGPAVAVTDSDFGYAQTAANSPTVIWSSANGSSSADFLVGGYLSGALNVRLTKSLGANLGVQFESLGDYSQQAGDKRATVDLGQSLFVSGGFSFSF